MSLKRSIHVQLKVSEMTLSPVLLRVLVEASAQQPLDINQDRMVQTIWSN